MAESSADGLRSWQTVYRDDSTPVTSSSRTFYAGGGNRYVTNTAPNGSYTVSAYSNGRLASVTFNDSGGGQIMKTTYGYDAHGRQGALTDARNGTTSLVYNNADLLTSVTTPNPGTGGSAQTTLTYYNAMLQATNVVNPDGTSVTSEYYPSGELKRNYGARVYPAGYSYDYAGRQKTMTNWSDFAGGTGARVTTWNYDAYRGWLTNKTYDGGVAGPIYTSTPAGRLSKRTWARGVTTTYLYNNAGHNWAVNYSDTTPAVTNSFDRLGRVAWTACNGMVDYLAYNTANQLLSETFSGGTLGGLAVTNAFDAYLRRTAVGLSTQPSTLVKYAYDNGPGSGWPTARIGSMTMTAWGR